MVEELRIHAPDGRAVHRLLHPLQRHNGAAAGSHAGAQGGFAHTSLVDTAFQFLPVGVSHGHTVFLFDYPAGSMSVGGGGGLAYFLAVEITLLIAQVINFFCTAQRHLQVQLVDG